MRSVLDSVHSNLQHNCLNNIEQIKFFTEKNISVYSTQHGLSKYVKIFERLYLNIRKLAILSEMCTDFGEKKYARTNEQGARFRALKLNKNLSRFLT